MFFSIVIPLYNKADFVEKTLDSVLAQGFSDFEAIVVDDGSSDDGPMRVKAYEQRDARVRLVHQENGGVSSARNHGISAAKGKYVAFLDADDWWEPNHLAELNKLANAFPQAGLLGTSYVRRYAKPPHFAIVLSKYDQRRSIVEDYFGMAAKYQFIYTSSIAAPLRVLEGMEQLFPEGVRNGEDLDLWARIASDYPVAYSGNVTVNYNCDASGQATRAVGRMSLYPALTLTKLIMSAVETSERKMLLNYGEHILFTRSLTYALSGQMRTSEYFKQTGANEWSTRFVNRMLRLNCPRLVCRMISACIRAINSRKIPFCLSPDLSKKRFY